MRVLVIKTTSGKALLGYICNEEGRLLDPDIEGTISKLLSNNPDYVSIRVTNHLNLPGGNGIDKYDNTFKEAFTDELEGDQVKIDLTRAKVVAHRRRRSKRSEEFQEIDSDNMNMLVTPEAEARRLEVRNRYAGIQEELDQAVSPEELKLVMRNKE